MSGESNGRPEQGNAVNASKGTRLDQMSGPFYMYILSCADSSYYVGSTQNLQERFLAHNKGRAAKYTALRRPVSLVYSEEHPSAEMACARERQIKKWTRAKKEALISGDRKALKELSKKCH
jgi:predicted GIY-YIG superfamily endonuclease